MSKLISIAMWLAATLAVFPSATLHAQPADDFVIVSGSAAYRQRIAMPPDAVLTVRVEDVSRADAPAPVLAETSEPFGARQVPIAFSLNSAERGHRSALQLCRARDHYRGREIALHDHAQLCRADPRSPEPR